jgi:hypothetical protein
MAFATLLAAALIVAQTSADGLLTQLQRAIGRNDRQAVAALVQYPIIVTTAGIRISIRDAASLVESYDAVFTPDLEAAIRNGSAIRDGLIQITSAQGVVRIASISAPSRSGTDSVATRPPATRHSPRRVTFSMVEIAQFSGSLSAGRSDAYVAYVEKGRVLEARIERVRGRDIVLKVHGAKTGKPLDTKAAAGARVWIGRVPESADYRIDVTRPAQEGGQLLPYVLVVRRR